MCIPRKKKNLLTSDSLGKLSEMWLQYSMKIVKKSALFFDA